MRVIGALALAACATAPRSEPGHAMIVCGEPFPAGTRVVLWNEPDGHDAYPGGHFGARETLPGEPTVEDLRRVVHQVVIHYDATGTSKRCFQVLEKRGLSCHFLLDTDGTVYQTLDLKERAWHAADANTRSVGIEVANYGAYGSREKLARFQAPGPVVSGKIHGVELHQYAFTDAQYRSLRALLRALSGALPAVRLEAPDAATTLPADEARAFRGIVAHYHLTRRKVDPGPAFDWQRVLD